MANTIETVARSRGGREHDRWRRDLRWYVDLLSDEESVFFFRDMMCVHNGAVPHGRGIAALRAVEARLGGSDGDERLVALGRELATAQAEAAAAEERAIEIRDRTPELCGEPPAIGHPAAANTSSPGTLTAVPVDGFRALRESSGLAAAEAEERAARRRVRALMVLIHETPAATIAGLAAKLRAGAGCDVCEPALAIFMMSALRDADRLAAVGAT